MITFRIKNRDKNRWRMMMEKDINPSGLKIAKFQGPKIIQKI